MGLTQDDKKRLLKKWSPHGPPRSPMFRTERSMSEDKSPLNKWAEDGDPKLDEAYRNANRSIVVCVMLMIAFAWWWLVS